jgi:hypothetical protein
MSDKAKNHGHIQPATPEPKRQVVLPRIFRGRITKTYSDVATNERFYGLWEMKALRDVSVYNTIVPAGDLFKIAGNVGCALAQYGDAMFVDIKLEREQEILDEMKKLGLDQPAQPEPANFPTTQPERSWKVK